MTKRSSPIPPVNSMQREWLRDPVERAAVRHDVATKDRFEAVDGNALLTDLQRTALRWLAFFD